MPLGNLLLVITNMHQIYPYVSHTPKISLQGEKCQHCTYLLYLSNYLHHCTLVPLIIQHTDMINFRFSLKIYIFKFMIIDFLSCIFMDSSKILSSYIIYVRNNGINWRMTGLNINMQE